MSEKEKAIRELKAQIRTMLEQRPELKPFQDEIDRRMSKIIDPVDRFHVLSFMISASITELQNLSATLSDALSDTV